MTHYDIMAVVAFVGWQWYSLQNGKDNECDRTDQGGGRLSWNMQVMKYDSPWNAVKRTVGRNGRHGR